MTSRFSSGTVHTVPFRKGRLHGLRGLFSRKPQPAAVAISRAEVHCKRTFDNRKAPTLRLQPWAAP